MKLTPFIVCGLGSLGLSTAWADDTVALPDGWNLLRVFTYVRDMTCSSDQVFVSARADSVHAHDGSSWTQMSDPPEPSDSFDGPRIFALAAGSDGSLYRSWRRGLFRWDDGEWTQLRFIDWHGEVHGMDVLDTGELIVLGSRRVGLSQDDEIHSYDSGTWRELYAVDGPHLVDMWAVGGAGLIQHHSSEGWTQVHQGMERVSVRMGKGFSGVYSCGADCAWVWDSRDIYRWDGETWSLAPKVASDSYGVVAMTGSGTHPWIVTGSHVAQWDGDSWSVELDKDELGETDLRFSRACATIDRLYVLTRDQTVWVRDLSSP